MLPEVIFWIGLLLLFAIGEGLSVGLTSIWFAVGSLGGLLCATGGLSQWVQAVVFIALSGLSLILLRPIAKRALNSKTVATNADRIIGKTAVVTEEIDNLKGAGLANVSGQVWTARSVDGAVVPPGALVEIIRIEGVKILVKASEQDAEK